MAKKQATAAERALVSSLNRGYRERQKKLSPQAITFLGAEALDKGGFFVIDCFPWAIKDGCTRADCPMRQVAIIPGLPLDKDEPDGSELALKCDPAGVLADFLLAMQGVIAAGADREAKDEG